MDNAVDIGMKSLKISTLLNAAKISPYVKNMTFSEDQPVYFERAPSSVATKTEPLLSETVLTDSEQIYPKPKLIWRQTYDEESSVLKVPNLVTQIDRESMSQSIRLKNVERERCAALKLENHKRHAREVRENEIRNAKQMEMLKLAEIRLLHKRMESEKLILNALAAQELIEREFDIKHKAEIELHQENVRRQKDRLQKIEETKKKNDFLTVIIKYQHLFKEVYEKFLTHSTQANFYAHCSKVQPLYDSYNSILKSINQNQVSESVVSLAQSIYEKMFKILEEIENEIATTQKESFEQLRHQQAVEVADTAATATIQQAQTPVEPIPVSAPPPPIPTPTTPIVKRLVTINPDKMIIYKAFCSYHQNYVQRLRPLFDDPQYKKFRFDCQKAINIPLNAISAVNPQHLADKYHKLYTLLSGNPVQIGDNKISCAHHPLGKELCIYLLAKNFVNQADTMISSNANAAYPIASVLVALWQEFPELGNMFLANLYNESPLLVPYYSTQFDEGNSKEDYWRKLGYRYSNGVSEKQDSYLKRMSGIARLYFAVLITHTRSNEKRPHPHNLSNGFMWLVNFLNLDPLPDICATILSEFLQIAGHRMYETYGKQFVKLIRFMHQNYMVELSQIDTGGPKSRLEVLIDQALKTQRLMAPQSLVPPNFW